MNTVMNGLIFLSLGLQGSGEMMKGCERVAEYVKLLPGDSRTEREFWSGSQDFVGRTTE